MPSDLWNRAMHEAQSGRLQEAVAAARLRVRMKPKDPEATELLGLLLERAGETEQALHYLRRGVELLPQEPMHRHNLALALMNAGRGQEARAIWEEVVRLHPDMVHALLGLSAVRAQLADTAGAIEAARRGLALQPDWPPLVSNLAYALAWSGQVEESVAVSERCVRRFNGEASVWSSMLLALHYVPRTREAMLEAHQAFGAVLPKPQPPPALDPSAPLRIGLLSSDLRSHSVGFFARALVEHAPPGTEIVAFSTSVHRKDDPLMRELRARTTRWHDVADLAPEALEALIRSERIAVLLELNGHTTGNRLEALATRPAPVIVTAIGYPDTTGVPAVGWRLVDSVTDPAGAEAFCTERLLRLDPCFLCYTPPEAAPAPAMPPDDAPFTFGSFNNAQKIGDACVTLWAGALAAVPGSRLLVKSLGIDDPSLKEWLLSRLERAGVARDRVETVGYTGDRGDHLALYRRVHAALDTTPYNGTTTTCEALWMGVPVVATLGDRHAARVSASLLRAAGFAQWIADDAAGFARIAAGLAADRAALAALRASMRDTLRVSPLLDAPAYARRLHGALRDLYSSAR